MVGLAYAVQSSPSRARGKAAICSRSRSKHVDVDAVADELRAVLLVAPERPRLRLREVPVAAGRP